MNTNIADGVQRLLLCLTVLSMLVAPAGAVVWPSEDTDHVTSSSPPTRVPQDHEEGPDSTKNYALIPPEIGVSAEGVEFGRVRVGGPETASSTEILTARNGGDAPLSIEAATITGPNAAAFEIVSGGETTTLAPGERRAIAIMFAPESAGDATATLQIESNDPEQEQVSIDLTGTGVAPDIEVTPKTLRFPNATDRPATETLTITNEGTAPLTVEAIRIVGPDRTVFESAVGGPVTIAPNQSQSVAVTLDQTEATPRFATIHVISDDPDEPQRNIWLTNTPMVADVSPSTVLADRTIVNTTVTNARANTSHSINISWPLTRDDDVAVDSLTFTPERTGNFTINVTKSSERFEGTPPFNLSDGTEDVAFISMNGSISNEALSNVSVTFRVSKAQLAENETGPEDVTLYTRQNGTWTELPTELVDESETHYFFEAKSPGLLDFATGIKQAKFRIDDAVVSVTELRTGEGVDVLVRVTNVGGADGTHVVKLIRNDTEVDRRELSIAPNGTRQTVFTQSFDQPGIYELYVNDRFVANVTVRLSENATSPSRATSDRAVSIATPDRAVSADDRMELTPNASRP